MFDISLEKLLKDVTRQISDLFDSKTTFVRPKPPKQKPFESKTDALRELDELSSGDIQAPIKGVYYSSGKYSPNAPTDARHKSGHKGVDLRASGGTPVYPITDGVVTHVGYSGKGGNTITIMHTGGIKTYNAHMADITVQKGDKVNKSTVIGHVGNSGNAINTAPHIHFQLWENGVLQDPGKYFHVPKYTDMSAEEKENIWLPGWQEKQKKFKMASHVAKRIVNFSREVDKLHKLASKYEEFTLYF